MAYTTTGKPRVLSFIDPGDGPTCIVEFQRSDKTEFRATFTDGRTLDHTKYYTITGELTDDPFSVTGSCLLNPTTVQV